MLEATLHPPATHAPFVGPHRVSSLLFILVFFLIYVPVANRRLTGLGLVVTLLGVPVYTYGRRSRP
jgi:hypothetical protein